MSKFIAKIFRLKYIRRWSLMRNVEYENVMEHSFEVAVMANYLATIAKHKFKYLVDIDRVTTRALFHDAPECITSDIPTPVKYSNSNILHNIRNLEVLAKDKLLSDIDEEYRYEYDNILNDEYGKDITKQADLLCAYIKSCREVEFGNKEFTEAKHSLLTKLKDLESDVVNYFLEECLKDFTSTIDDITEEDDNEEVILRT